MRLQHSLPFLVALLVATPAFAQDAAALIARGDSARAVFDPETALTAYEAALALDSTDWVEAEPGTSQTPMCFFSAGMLADFLGRVSDEPVSVMEVECRSRGDERCRFLSATPDVLQRVYEAMTEGRSYEEALNGEPR